jgi:hypothetical protein
MPEEIWGRRAATLGAGLVAAAIIGGLVLIADNESTDGSTRSPAERVEKVARDTLDRSAEDKRHGIELLYPSSWKETHTPGAIALESPGGCVTVSLSSPGKAADAKRVRDAAIDEVRASVKHVKVTRGGGRVVGGVTMSGAALEISSGGKSAQMLLLAGPGQDLAYVLQTLIRGSCPSDLLQAREIIGSSSFSR